jgi:hypothetical protein
MFALELFQDVWNMLANRTISACIFSMLTLKTLLLWYIVSPKRKGLGKQNEWPWVKGWVNENKTTAGLGNKIIVISEPWWLGIEILKTIKQCQHYNSRMSIQYVNQSESLSWSFSDLSGGKWCLHRKYMCRQHETLDCRKLHKYIVINETHVTEVVKDMCDNYWMVYVYFCKVLARGGYLFFGYLFGIFSWLDQQNVYQENHPTSVPFPP